MRVIHCVSRRPGLGIAGRTLAATPVRLILALHFGRTCTRATQRSYNLRTAARILCQRVVECAASSDSIRMLFSSFYWIVFNTFYKLNLYKFSSHSKAQGIIYGIKIQQLYPWEIQAKMSIIFPAQPLMASCERRMDTMERRVLYKTCEYTSSMTV